MKSSSDNYESPLTIDETKSALPIIQSLTAATIPLRLILFGAIIWAGIVKWPLWLTVLIGGPAFFFLKFLTRFASNIARSLHHDIVREETVFLDPEDYIEDDNGVGIPPPKTTTIKPAAIPFLIIAIFLPALFWYGFGRMLGWVTTFVSQMW